MEPISDIQQRYLADAENAPVNYLWRLIMESIEADDGRLDPRWRAMWERVRERTIRHGMAPQGAIDRIDEAIAAIQFVDPKIGENPLAENDRVCLLLGAGASAPSPSSIPTVMQLLPELWRRARKIGRDDIDKLAAWCEDHDIQNIEDLLTAAYLADFAAKNSSVSGLLDYFLFRSGGAEEMERRRLRGGVPRVDAASIALLQDTLQVLFGLLTGTMIPAAPNKGHEAIVRFVKSHKKTSIVTTNYDGCIDEALIKAKVPLNFYVDEAEATQNTAKDLVKIHGSINWSYCESCHEVRDFDLIALKDAYESDTATFAVIGICKNCGGQRRPLLIPPLGFKFIMFPSLIRLWNRARECIEQADHLIVVGYSFSDADTYINKIIERSMTLNEKQRIVVCDPNPRLVSTLRKRYSARVEGFHADRILPAVGSADEILPQVLESLVSPKPAPSDDDGKSNGSAAPKKKRRSTASKATKEDNAV